MAVTGSHTHVIFESVRIYLVHLGILVLHLSSVPEKIGWLSKTECYVYYFVSVNMVHAPVHCLLLFVIVTVVVMLVHCSDYGTCTSALFVAVCHCDSGRHISPLL